MGIVAGALSGFAKTELGTNLYGWGATEGGKRFLCEKIPLIDTVIATASRVYATEKQDLSRREKNILQAGHIVPAIAGIGIGSVLNKKVYDFGNKIGNLLDPKKVQNIDKVKGAIQVIGPIFTTALLLRYILPIVTAFASSCVEEKKNRLDIRV